MPTKKVAAVLDLDVTRSRQRRLLAANPNYFGTQPDLGYKVVEKIIASTSYEELTSVGYNPRSRRAYATFDVKRSTGYGGDLCHGNGAEYVRFYAEDGSGGWVDLGVAGTDVHDIPAGRDCARENLHPLSYTVEVTYAPPRRWCFIRQLRAVRAILSYGVVPPPNQPNWTPVWGNVHECPVQIDKTGFLTDLFLEEKFTATVDPALLAAITPYLPTPPTVDPGDSDDVPVLAEAPGPAPSPLSLAERLELYGHRDDRANFTVEPARFALADLQALSATPSFSLSAQKHLAGVLQDWQIDLSEVLGVVEDTTGNISFEELVDVGLDYRRQRVDATYVLKKASGFSGGLCTAGSVEHVAFWADWDDTCEWTYLGTVQVKAYDFGRLPDGRLCYTASLPVDLSEVMERCLDPKVGKVRAVLSWNTPPSTTDADEVPTYGNRLDAHVLLPVRATPPEKLAIVGGVPATSISDVTGLTLPGATFDGSFALVDSLNRPCPFGQQIKIQGIGPVGTRYRIRVANASGGVQTLASTFTITDLGGTPSDNTPTVDGWYTYKSSAANVSATLALYQSSGNDKVDIILEIEGAGDVDHQVVQLDNTWPTVSIEITTPGDCDVAAPGVAIEGTVTADDDYFGSWSVVIDGGPPLFGPELIASGTTPPTAVAWSTGHVPGFPVLEACGYVARVVARDRAIVNNGTGSHQSTTDVGFSVM